MMMLWLNIQEISLIVLGCITFLLLLYYLLFAKFSFYKAKKVKNLHQQPVSIIIAAHNEAHHLIKTLPGILKQQYYEYEVVVVNDNSTDETEQVVRDYMVQYPHLKLVNMTSSVTTIQGKKFPLSIGIKSAKYETLLLTGADCVPSSPYWLLNMAKHFQNKTRIVIGYSTVEKKKSFMNRFVHFDNMVTAMQYFSYALAGMPFMGDGRNLAYTKAAFYDKKGFAAHNHIKYGDDDIFINRIATKENTKIECFSEAFTISRYKPGFKNWFREKSNRVKARKFFKKKHNILLYVFSFVSFIYYPLLIAVILFTFSHTAYLFIALGLFLFKLLLQYFIYGFSAAKLGEKQVIPFILLFDILNIFIQPFIFLSTFFSTQRKWK